MIGSIEALLEAGTIPTPKIYTKLAISMVIPIINIAPTAPANATKYQAWPVIEAAVISPVKPAPAANIAVPVPTPVAVDIAAGAPPTGMKCTPPPMQIPPATINMTNVIKLISSIMKPPYSSYGPNFVLANFSRYMLPKINNTMITIPTICPGTVPNTKVIQKLTKTMSPKQNPVKGPPYLAQKLPTSIEFFAPVGALVTISPWIATGVPPPYSNF